MLKRQCNAIWTDRTGVRTHAWHVDEKMAFAATEGHSKDDDEGTKWCRSYD